MSRTPIQQKALRLPVELDEAVERAAKEAGIKINPWIVKACEEKLARDAQAQIAPKPAKARPRAISDAERRARLRKGRKP